MAVSSKKNSRLRKTLTKVGIYGCCGMLVLLLGGGAYILAHATKDTRHTADAIVILGSHSTDNGNRNPCLVARVAQGVALYQKHLAPKIIVTGGDDSDAPTNEAKTMAAIATAAGIPPDDLILEDKAMSTYENVTFSKKLLEQLHAKSVIVVTEPYHSPRAELVARANLKQQVYVSPAINSICWKNPRYTAKVTLREIIALYYYIVTGKI